jgi:hypothetical protein
MKAYVVFIGIALLTACATPTVEPTAREGEPTVLIYLVSHGWHTGLVIRCADVPEGAVARGRQFPAGRISRNRLGRP